MEEVKEEAVTADEDGGSTEESEQRQLRAEPLTWPVAFFKDAVSKKQKTKIAQ